MNQKQQLIQNKNASNPTLYVGSKHLINRLKKRYLSITNHVQEVFMHVCICI